MFLLIAPPYPPYPLTIMKTLNTTHKQTSIGSYHVSEGEGPLSVAQPSQVLCEEGGSIDIGEKLNMKQEDRHS